MFGSRVKSEELVEREQELHSKVEEYKAQWDKSGVIQFKNESIAVLFRTLGRQVEFIVAFDELTMEGYELKGIDAVKEAAGIGGGVNSYYYFQKLKPTSQFNRLG